MSTEYLINKLNKIVIQQQQWHDEFIQREGFWLFMAGAALATLFMKLL